MGNWRKYIGFNLFKGHKVIREKDAFAAGHLYADKHPGFFKVKETREIDGVVIGCEWLDPSMITLPIDAWQEGYKQAVRDQRKLMREEYDRDGSIG